MRIDKYDPKDGGFRAPLEEDQAATPGQVGDANAGIGVGLTANGTVVPLGHADVNTTGVKGVLVLTKARNATEIVDVMTDGEIVEFGGTPGTDYYVDPTTGTVSDNPDATAADSGIYVGHTVEGGRLIVRVAR